jgi:hypothetical protein
METEETYARELASRLDRLDREIERLKTKIATLDAQAEERAACVQQLDHLCPRVDELRVKQQEIATAREGRLEHLKAEVENIWDELKKSFHYSAKH